MVDRILGKEEQQEEKKDMFIITNSQSETPIINDFEIVGEETFIQEEYDLQLQIQQINTRMDFADEF